MRKEQLWFPQFAAILVDTEMMGTYSICYTNTRYFLLYVHNDTSVVYFYIYIQYIALYKIALLPSTTTTSTCFMFLLILKY